MMPSIGLSKIISITGDIISIAGEIISIVRNVMSIAGLPIIKIGNNIEVDPKVRFHTPSPQSGPLPLS